MTTSKRRRIVLARYMGWRHRARCRSSRTLFNFEPPVIEREILTASLQFVKKVEQHHDRIRVRLASNHASEGLWRVLAVRPTADE
ncbi:MAG: DUF2277 domain-containing protein [Chloroflexota bacterium]|nr:DUF2277 domain-containing protein [Chloroflexota bacterium]MDP9469781.1 DUF2277 domain-containing protein [Chloroflexota bacterium]